MRLGTKPGTKSQNRQQRLGYQRARSESVIRTHGSQAIPKLALAGATREKTPAGLLRLATNHPPPSILMPPGGLGWDPSPVFMPVTTHSFSIHCYRNMLATDFAAYGLPRSLRKPRVASSFETSRNDNCPPLGRRLRSLRARATASGCVSRSGFLPSHRPSRSRLRFRAAASFATLLAFSN